MYMCKYFSYFDMAQYYKFVSGKGEVISLILHDILLTLGSFGLYYLNDLSEAQTPFWKKLFTIEVIYSESQVFWKHTSEKKSLNKIQD